MGWMDVDEPFSAAPKLGAGGANKSGGAPFDQGLIEIDRGFAELNGLDLRDEQVDLTGAEEVSFDGCKLGNTELRLDERAAVEVVASHIEGCDLSQVTFSLVRRSTFSNTKLVGTDFSGIGLTDVVFTNCVIRLSTFRMATLTRVRFEDCVLDDVDLYDAALVDVDMAGSELVAVNIDSVRAERVDLRGAASLGLKGARRFSGFLVEESQLIGLAFVLAAAVDLDVERPSTI